MLMPCLVPCCWCLVHSSVFLCIKQNLWRSLHAVFLTELSPWPLVGLWGVFGTLWAPRPPSQLDIHPVTPCRPSSSSICRWERRRRWHILLDWFIEGRKSSNHHGRTMCHNQAHEKTLLKGTMKVQFFCSYRLFLNSRFSSVFEEVAGLFQF